MKSLKLFLLSVVLINGVAGKVFASEYKRSQHEVFADSIAKLLEFNLNGYDLIMDPNPSTSRKATIVGKKLDITEHCFFYLSALIASQNKQELTLTQQQYLTSMHIYNIKKLSDNQAELSDLTHIKDFGADHIRNLGLKNFCVKTFPAKNSGKKSLSKAKLPTTKVFIGEGVHCAMPQANWDIEATKIQ